MRSSVRQHSESAGPLNMREATGLFTSDALPLSLTVVHTVTNQSHPSVLLLPHASHPSIIL